MNNTQKVLTTLAGVATVGVISLVPSSASAAGLTGDFSFGGNSLLAPPLGPVGANPVTASFVTSGNYIGSGDFDTSDINPDTIMINGSITNSSTPPTAVFDLVSGNNQYNNRDMITIEFKSLSSDDYKIEIDALQDFERSVNFMAGTSSVDTVETLFLHANAFKNGSMMTEMEGSLNIGSTSANTGTYSLTLAVPIAPVPEPSSALSLLALGCLGGGAMAKRALAGKLQDK